MIGNVRNFWWILLGPWARSIWGKENPFYLQTYVKYPWKTHKIMGITIPALCRNSTLTLDSGKRRQRGRSDCQREISSPWEQLSVFLHWSLNTRWFTNLQEVSN